VIPIPFLQQFALPILYQFLNISKLVRSETQVSGETDWAEPELCRIIVPINVDMRGFVRFMAIEEKSIWALSKAR